MEPASRNRLGLGGLAPSAPAVRGGPGAVRRPLRPRLPLRYEGEDGVRATRGPQPVLLPRGPPGSGAPCRGVPAAGLRGGDRAEGRAVQLPRVRWDLVAGEARLRSGRAAGGQAPTGGERRNPETELEKVPPAAVLREMGTFPQDPRGGLLGRPGSFVRNGSYLFGVFI